MKYLSGIRTQVHFIPGFLPFVYYPHIGACVTGRKGVFEYLVVSFLPHNWPVGTKLVSYQTICQLLASATINIGSGPA